MECNLQSFVAAVLKWHSGNKLEDVRWSYHNHEVLWAEGFCAVGDKDMALNEY